MLARRVLTTAIVAAALSTPTALAFADANAPHGKSADHNPHLVTVVAPAPAPVVTVTPPATPAVTVTAATNPYAPSNVGGGTPQGNGNAPANGTVGKADNKNPPGQAPNGTDHNNGYECDKNHGVGNKGGNPAHSGCATKTTPPPTVPPTTPPPSKSASPSPTPPHIIVCKSNCGHEGRRSPSPTPKPCVKDEVDRDGNPSCLPFTGAKVSADRTLLVGGELVFAGLMILALLNLQTQVRRYRAM